MLRKEYRLPANVRLHHPKVIKNTFFLAKLSDNKLENNRYGFIVGKTIDKRATHRNFMRRRMRQIAWENNLIFPQGMDILFSVTRAPEKKQFLTCFQFFLQKIINGNL